MFGPIRRLGPDDLPACLALTRDRRWPPEKNRWELLFGVGEVYGVPDESGGLAASVVLTRFGTQLAVIGMMLVAARYERHGLGRALMGHVLAEAGDVTVMLNATDAGRPLYEKLGFGAAGTIHTHLGSFTPPGAGGGRRGPGPGAGVAPSSRPAAPGDLPAIRALDARAHGADRAYLVRRLPGFCAALRVAEQHGRVTGYAGAWRSVTYTVIGPVIAAGAADPAALIAGVAGAVTGPVRVDLDDRHAPLRAWAARRGLTRQNSATIMVHGGRPLPGDRSVWFAPLTQALG